MTNKISGTPFPLGAYFGYGEAAFDAANNGFVSTMGTAPQFLNSFLDFRQPVSDWASYSTMMATSSAQYAANLTPVIDLAMTSTAAGSMTSDQQFQAFTAGDYDSVLAGIVKAWAQQGFTNLVFRVGSEMNLPGVNYAGDTVQSQADWVAAFQHIYTRLHAAAAADGVTVQVVWNPDADGGGSVTNLYPGNAYVDVIGADIYSNMYPYRDTASPTTYHDWATGGENTSLAAWMANPINREHYWSYPGANKWTNQVSDYQSPTLTNLIQFAEQQDKPFAIPETGAGNSAGGTDVNDDAAFPQWLAQQLTTGEASGLKVDFVNIWNSNDDGNYAFSAASDGKPQEAAAWAQVLRRTGSESLDDRCDPRPGDNGPNHHPTFVQTTGRRHLRPDRYGNSNRVKRRERHIVQPRRRQLQRDYRHLHGQRLRPSGHRGARWPRVHAGPDARHHTRRGQHRPHRHPV